MGYNSKILADAIKKLNERKVASKPKDIPLDVKGNGMLDPRFAGKPVKLNTDTLYNPTPYKIKAVADNGVKRILNPFDESNVYFPGANTITEYPIEDYTDKYLTDEEIQAYRDGGYIVEELPEMQPGGWKPGPGFKPGSLPKLSASDLATIKKEVAKAKPVALKLTGTVGQSSSSSKAPVKKVVGVTPSGKKVVTTVSTKLDNIDNKAKEDAAYEKFLDENLGKEGSNTYTYVDPITGKTEQREYSNDHLKEPQGILVDEATWNANRDRQNMQHLSEALSGVGEITGINSAIRTGERLIDDPLKFADDLTTGISQAPETLVEGAMTLGSKLFGDNKDYVDVDTDALGVALDVAGALPVFGVAGKAAKPVLKRGLKYADDVNYGSDLIGVSRKANKGILSSYKNIEELRLAKGYKDFKTANQHYPELFPDEKVFTQTKKEAENLLKEYKPKFEKQFGKGKDEEILVYGAHDDLGKMQSKDNFLVDDEFAKSSGLDNDLSNQQKFLGDTYQLEFSGYFNKSPNQGGNKNFAEYLSKEFEPVIASNKVSKPVQVKRTSSFSRPVKTMRGDQEMMVNYDDLMEGDIIYPEHNWSTTTDMAGDVWGSGSPTSKVAVINVPEGQSAFRPNMFKDSQYINEQELVLPSKLGYKVSGVNTQGFGNDAPRFIFDVHNPYKRGGQYDDLKRFIKGGQSDCPPGTYWNGTKCTRLITLKNDKKYIDGVANWLNNAWMTIPATGITGATIYGTSENSTELQNYKEGGYINKMSKGGEAIKVINYLMSQGLTRQQASGIAGNLQQESSFRPNAKGSLGHVGIAQWDKNDRWPKVKKYIESQGLDPFSLDGQLAGLVWEAKKRKDWDKILKTKTPEESAQTWLKHFEISGEKPGQKGYDNRLKYAKSLATQRDPNSPFDESVRDLVRLEAYREGLKNKSSVTASNEIPYRGIRYNYPTAESSSNIDPLLTGAMNFNDDVTLDDIKPKTESSNLFASLLNMISAQEQQKEKEKVTEDPRQEILKLMSQQYPAMYAIGNTSHRSFENPFAYANDIGLYKDGGQKCPEGQIWDPDTQSCRTTFKGYFDMAAKAYKGSSLEKGVKQASKKIKELGDEIAKTPVGQEALKNYNEIIERDIIKLQDPRKTRATTGQAINPNRDLVSGEYNWHIVTDIINRAKKEGIDPYTALAIGLQESQLGKTDKENIGHSLYTNFKEDPYSYISFYKQKLNEADKANVTDEAARIQYYNGLGIVTPRTEKNYHGYEMQSIYGVPIPSEGINLKNNPLYGKQIIDLRDNVIKHNDRINQYIQNYKQKGGGVILELDDEEIKRYLLGGYNVEEY